MSPQEADCNSIATNNIRAVNFVSNFTLDIIVYDGNVSKYSNSKKSERSLSMVFQSYALYPHKTVRDNMGFPLKMAGEPKEQVAAAVKEAANVLQLGPLLDRLPKELSGGQRQRVAIGRSIVRAPLAFLFDEPLSNLDAALRVQMRASQYNCRTTSLVSPSGLSYMYQVSQCHPFGVLIRFAVKETTAEPSREARIVSAPMSNSCP